MQIREIIAGHTLLKSDLVQESILTWRPMSHIKFLSCEQIDQYVEHLSRLIPEPGVGEIVSQPFPPDEPIDKVKYKNKILDKWSIKPGEGSWEETWGLFEGNEIVGHVELNGISMPAIKHRAKVGINFKSLAFKVENIYLEDYRRKK